MVVLSKRATNWFILKETLWGSRTFVTDIGVGGNSGVSHFASCVKPEWRACLYNIVQSEVKLQNTQHSVPSRCLFILFRWWMGSQFCFFKYLHDNVNSWCTSLYNFIYRNLCSTKCFWFLFLEWFGDWPNHFQNQDDRKTFSILF